MPPPEKPRHRSGYSPQDTTQVQSACLTIAVTLGAYLDELCIVGGLVPSLLIDLQQDGSYTEPQDGHPGTDDLDIGLALALLDDERYAEISARLRQEGFKPDVNDKGNNVLQRWRLGDLKATVDFLIPPAPGQDTNLRVQPLESDFGAYVTPGLELAFDECVPVEVDGHTLKGEHATRTIPVCGPGAFVVLKALAFADRAEPKDAYDLVYVLSRTPGGAGTIAEPLASHANNHPDVVDTALRFLARDFSTPDSIGPLRAAEFTSLDPTDIDDEAADAHGYVDDLLRSCETISPPVERNP